MTEDDNKIRRMTEMAKILGQAQAKVDKLTADLEKAEKDLQRIEREDMPELMHELEMTKFTLKDGTEIEVVEDFNCGISEANKPAAHDWMRKHNFGGLIKTTLAVDFGRDEDEAALKLAGKIRKLTNHPVIQKEGVHHQTLKAFIREQREKGTNLPEKIFGLNVFSKAVVTIKQPKGKRNHG
jgi:hypothetical protein